ncbi:MAG: DUF3567 domain-containing protein [Zoogloeaceae bacterium]|jgi:hypothetical protein|nr:DUF3567 domain-containing protein [Zoogloeaceae bacterium]
MEIVYDSPHYAVFTYPPQDGFELLDKDTMRTLFLQGVFACHFRSAISDIPENERTIENIDAFLEDYCQGSAAQPIVLH